MERILRESLRRPLLTYSCAVLISLAALGVHRALEPILGLHMPFLIYYPAIVAAALIGGLGPGVLATFLSAGLVLLSGLHYAPMVGLVTFVIAGTLASIGSEVARRSNRASVVARDAREHMLAIVAHDLRNPLSAVTLAARTLRMKDGSPHADRAASVIERNAARMEHLILDLLDATRLENGGELGIARRDEDARTLVHESIEVAEPRAREKTVTLDMSMPEELLEVSCDRCRILQVLGNLVGNAIHFTPPGGKISITVAETAGMVRFEVADTGPGVTNADMPHLFERHWKGRASHGTGLGLFIAAGIVRTHGGRIWCHSEPGYGASFFFTLPLGRAAAPAQHHTEGLGLPH
ncbi:MAG TPA: HAMP domain-containing sensor histidine kinase [Polyangiaceae bacterium]